MQSLALAGSLEVPFPALQMLEQPFGPENNCLIKACSRLDPLRPCGHTTVAVDEDPCNLLGSQQRSGIHSVFEDRLHLCPATLVFMCPVKVADHHPMMCSRRDPEAQIRSCEYHVSPGLVGDPLNSSHVAARKVRGWPEVG